MTQLIYAFAALVAVMGLSVSFNRGMQESLHRTMTNEVVTQLPGLAYDIIDDIGGMPFDEATNESLVGSPTFPMVTSETELSSPSDGSRWGKCTTTFASVNELNEVAGTGDCLDLDDFDGIKVLTQRNGIDLEAEVSVDYVDPDDPMGVTPAGQTFAKQVSVKIFSPAFVLRTKTNPDSLAPLEVEVSRIFTYNRSTTATP